MKNVAVVGGGPGGLFCTYLLNQKLPNVNVTIYEASSCLGGKIFTDCFSDGTKFEGGVAELYEYLGPGGKDPMRRIFEEDLGLQTVDMHGGCVVVRGKLLRDLDDVEREFGTATKECIQAFYAKCAELMPLEKYANRWQPDNEHPWANKTFRECLHTETCDPIAREYIEAAIASDLATESHTCNGLNAIKNALMDNDEYMQVYHVVGGLSKIPEVLAAKLRATFMLNTRVFAVERDHESFELIHDVSYVKREGKYILTVRDTGGEDHRREAYDAVFFCLPNHWMTQIRWGEASDAIHRILSHYDLPAHYLRVSMLFDTAWWNKLRIPGDFWMLDCLNGCCCYNESARWRSQDGHVLSFLLAGQDALLMCANDQDDEDIIEYVIDSLPDNMRLQAREQLLEAQVDRFVGSINAQPGGWPAKDLRSEHLPEPEKHPNLYLVGDYLFDSTLNAALFSANTAVNILVEQLGVELSNLTPAVENLGGPEVPL
jgi:monoamine oxidase